MEAPILKTKRLILRPFVASDVEGLVREILSDPDVLAPPCLKSLKHHTNSAFAHRTTLTGTPNPGSRKAMVVGPFVPLPTKLPSPEHFWAGAASHPANHIASLMLQVPSSRTDMARPIGARASATKLPGYAWTGISAKAAMITWTYAITPGTPALSALSRCWVLPTLETLISGDLSLSKLGWESIFGQERAPS